MTQDRDNSRDLRTAYFALVQFCPDPAREEYVNIAVVLEVPGYDFVGARIQPRMDGVLSCLAPDVDPSIVRLVTRGVLEKYTVDEPDHVSYRYIDNPAPKRIHEVSKALEHEHGSYWRVTQPRTTLLLGDQLVAEELEDLFSRFVRRGKSEPTSSRNKAWVRDRTVDMLRKHELEIEVNPSVTGEHFKSIPFDAVYRNGAATYLQFLSFDRVRQPSSREIAAFLYYVSDYRKAHKGHAGKVAAVLQPPRLKTAMPIYEESLASLDEENVPAFGTKTTDFAALARGLKEPGRLEEEATLLAP